jgi:hypothetical protein
VVPGPLAALAPGISLAEAGVMLRRRRLARWVLLAILVMTACYVVPDRILAFQLQREGLREVDATNGIQSAEADWIVETYSRRFSVGRMSSCSGTTTPVLVDGIWKAEELFGFGGERTGRWISVDPISGGVTSARGPTFKTFGSFRRAILLRAILSGR